MTTLDWVVFCLAAFSTVAAVVAIIMDEILKARRRHKAFEARLAELVAKHNGDKVGALIELLEELQVELRT